MNISDALWMRNMEICSLPTASNTKPITSLKNLTKALNSQSYSLSSSAKFQAEIKYTFQIKSDAQKTKALSIWNLITLLKNKPNGSWLIYRERVFLNNEKNLVIMRFEKEMYEKYEANKCITVASLFSKRVCGQQKYDKQFQLDLGSGVSAEGLRRKAIRKRGEGFAVTIDLKNASPDFQPLNVLTHWSRVYLIGHCNQDFLASSDNRYQLSIKDYVDIFAKYAPNLKKTTPDSSRVTISIVGCFAGDFAVNLSKALDQINIPALILAPNTYVGTEREEDNSQISTGKKLYGNKRTHETGDKLLVSTTQENVSIQIVDYSNC